MGPGVGRFRQSLTDLEKSKPLLNIVPQTRMTGAGLGGAAFEGEILDSQTQEQLVAIVWAIKGKRLSLSGFNKMRGANRVAHEG